MARLLRPKVEEWTTQRSRPAERFLVDGAAGDDRRAGHVAAAQRLRHGDDVRLEVPMLEAPPACRAAEAGLHFIADEQRAVSAAETLGAGRNRRADN